MAAELIVRITKRPDGSAVLRCDRPDGSATWQRQEGSYRFFPLHDLTHFAVEAELRFRQGFYGLIADGWSIEETGGKGARGPVPLEAMRVERIVGWLDAERASGTPLHDMPAPEGVSPGEMARVRQRRRELFGQWLALPRGETLELSFERA